MESSHATKGRATVGVGNLVTPPTPVHHSFTNTTHIGSNKTQGPGTPPESPLVDKIISTTSQDPTLFADNESERRDSPLFNGQEGGVVSPVSLKSQPQALSERPQTIIIPGTMLEIDYTPAAIMQYIQDRQDELGRYMAAHKSLLPKPQPSRAAPRDDVSARQLHKLIPAALVSTSTTTRKRKASQMEASIERSTLLPISSPTSVLSATPPARKRTRTSPKMVLEDDFHASSDKKQHKRAPATKKVVPADWRELPDFIPEVTEEELNELTVEWNHAKPLTNIENEPDFDELRGAEAKVCRILRLKPAQYLATKRRIFAAKVEYLRQGTEFKKTMAQTAGNIDVNKTSRLWDAFDRVGWFDAHRYKDVKGVLAVEEV